jgi:hypothetical protein
MEILLRILLSFLNFKSFLKINSFKILAILNTMKDEMRPRSTYNEMVFDVNKKRTNMTKIRAEYTHYLARQGSLEEMAEAIKIDPECVSHIFGVQKRTVLHTAIAEGRHDMVCLLLECKADVNVTDFRGGIPLWYSYDVNDAQAKIMTLLCDSKADIRLKSPEGFNSLHILAIDSAFGRPRQICEYENLLEVLLRYGAATLLDERDNQGRRPQNIVSDLFRNAIEKYGKPPS